LIQVNSHKLPVAAAKEYALNYAAMNTNIINSPRAMTVPLLLAMADNESAKLDLPAASSFPWSA
jgi:hypothetical protein